MSDSNGISPVIAIANAAGSAGKTTTAVTLATLLAETRPVLLIDGDAQATATKWLGARPGEGQPTLGDVLLRRASLDEATIETGVPGVRLVPSSWALDAAILELAGVRAGEQRLRLALDGRDPGVTVLIDCPGSVSTMTLAACVAADAVITVARPTLKEIEGIPQMQQLVNDVAEAYRPGLHLAAIVPCEVPASGRLYAEGVQLLEQHYPTLVTPSVRRTIKVPEAHAEAIPVPLWVPNEPVTADYRLVLAWLIERGVL